MTEAKQREKAQETLDIYAPLAHRLGISKIRTEMEDLCFKYLNPDAYYDLKGKIEKKKSEREQYVNRIVEEINEKIQEASIKGTVYLSLIHITTVVNISVSDNKLIFNGTPMELKHNAVIKDGKTYISVDDFMIVTKQSKPYVYDELSGSYGIYWLR